MSPWRFGRENIFWLALNDSFGRRVRRTLPGSWMYFSTTALLLLSLGKAVFGCGGSTIDDTTLDNAVLDISDVGGAFAAFYNLGIAVSGVVFELCDYRTSAKLNDITVGVVLGVR